MFITNKNLVMFDTYNPVDTHKLVGCILHESLLDMYEHNDRVTGCDIGAFDNEIFIAVNLELYHQNKPLHTTVNKTIELFINSYEFN